MHNKNKNNDISPLSLLYKRLEKYSSPSIWKSIWQICNSFVPYVGLWVLIIYSLTISYWLTGFLIILAAGFLVRLFIIFHDCGHGSYFKSKRLNERVGKFFGILSFTPYYSWHSQHLRHHATVGNLDKRGLGDVWTLTRNEYQSSTKWERVKYRLYRNPISMFVVGSIFLFLINNRFTKKYMSKKEKQNIYFTNVMLLVIFLSMGLLVGFWTYLIIQLLILYVSAIAGLWLFYMQHQYEDTSWFRNKDWNLSKVALEGSSYLKFPKLLHWFSGNIGFHHIHHMNARIPNYYLPQCFRENTIFQEVRPVTFLLSIKSLKLRLWDEKSQKLVGYKP